MLERCLKKGLLCTGSGLPGSQKPFHDSMIRRYFLGVGFTFRVPGAHVHLACCRYVTLAFCHHLLCSWPRAIYYINTKIHLGARNNQSFFPPRFSAGKREWSNPVWFSLIKICESLELLLIDSFIRSAQVERLNYLSPTCTAKKYFKCGTCWVSFFPSSLC